MAEFTLQPAAGAHGELTGVMMIKKYLKRKAKTQRYPDTGRRARNQSGIWRTLRI